MLSVGGLTFNIVTQTIVNYLRLTGFYRNYPGALNWNGSVSLGTSGNHLVNAGTAPTAGNLNGQNTAVFNGTTQFCSTAESVFTNYLSLTSFSGWILCNISSIGSDVAGPNGVNLICTQGTGIVMVYLRSSGKAGLDVFISPSGPDKQIEATFNINQWQLIQFYYDGNTAGGTQAIRVNEGAWSIATGIGTSILSTSAVMDIGRNVNSAAFLFINGQIADMGLTDKVLVQSDFDKIVTYIKNHYHLNLIFDVTGLSLTGLYRDYPGSLTWSGTASIGNSGSHSITTGTAPSAGTALNGHGTASFNGTTQFCSTAEAVFTNYFSLTNLSGWILCNISSIGSDVAGSGGVNLICTQGTSVAMVYLRSSGKVGLDVFINTIGDKQIETTFSTGAWQLIQFSYDGGAAGGTQSIRVNNGAWQTATAIGTSILSTAAVLDVGRNVTQTLFINGTIAEIGLVNTTLSQTDFDNVRACLNDRYQISV